MLPLVYRMITEDSSAAAIVGTRVYRHGAAPQKVTAPYVTWSVVSGEPENDMTSTPRTDRFEVQVDCWSDNDGSGDAGIEALATAVRAALETYGHMTRYSANDRDFDTQRFRISMDFTLFVHR